MRTLDLSPLYRSFIGLDHFANLVNDATTKVEKQTGYPLYNIETLDENTYHISIAVAGFAENDIDIQSEKNTLMVTGTKQNKGVERKFLYQGIAERNFERKFQLSDHVKVVSAELAHGMLTITLKREIPEALQAKKIIIKTKKLTSEKELLT